MCSRRLTTVSEANSAAILSANSARLFARIRTEYLPRSGGVSTYAAASDTVSICMTKT